MFMKCGKSNRAVFLNFTDSVKSFSILSSILLLSFFSQTQTSFQLKYILKKTGFAQLITDDDLNDNQKLLARVTFLRDSLELNPNDYNWHCLEFLTVLTSMDGLGLESKQEELIKEVEATKKFKNSYIHRLFLFAYGSSNIIGEENYDSSLNPLLRAIDLSKENGDKQMELDLCIQIADLYIDADQRKYAVKWFERAHPILAHVLTPQNANLYYTMRADSESPRVFDDNGYLIWKSEKQKKRAIGFANKGIYYGELAKKMGNPESVNLFLSYHIRADLAVSAEEELTYIKLSLENTYFLNNPWITGQEQLRIGSVYVKLDQFDLAKQYMDSTKPLFLSKEAPLILKERVHHFYTIYFKKVKNSDSLAYHLTQLMKVNKKMNTDQALVDLNLNESRFEDEKQKATIREQKLILTQEKSRSRWYTASFIISLLFVLLMLFILLRFRKQKREVEKKNSEIKN
ncbi:MAG: hypothetical protein COA38_19215, partial [Fluviicola sp.]